MKNLILLSLFIFISCGVENITPNIKIDGIYIEHIDPILNIGGSKLLITSDTIKLGFGTNNAFVSNFKGSYKLSSSNTVRVTLRADKHSGIVSTPNGTYTNMSIAISFKWLPEEQTLNAVTKWQASGWDGLEFESTYTKR